MVNISILVHSRLIKVSSHFDNHYHSLYEVRNAKSNGFAPEAHLQLRVKFYLGDKLNKWIKDSLDSCDEK